MSLPTMSRSTIYLLLVALGGCYAQLEDTDVAYVRSSICGPAPGCVGNNIPINPASNFTPPIEFDLGNAGLLTNSVSKQGPITFHGGVLLNQAVVAMTTPDSGNFNGLRTVEVRAAASGNTNCAQISSTCKSLAIYDSSRDGVAQKSLVLKGNAVNLSDLAGPSNRLSVYVRATGNAPAVATWNADLELDLAIKARGDFP